tara:strand:+ start:1075 stop:1527 length:453 start_codon:yes stop_codon:yes gene_type:complete
MNHEFYIKECISLAKRSAEFGEIPVGAMLLQKNKIISKAHNTSISLNDPTGHAEINAIRDACKKINNYRISDAILYVTLEPCLMCISAICEARIDLVVFGAYTSNEKNFFSKYDFIKKEFRFNHKPKFMGGILENECSILMKEFFKAKRG